MGILTNGSTFTVRSFRNGFSDYVDQTGLVQNKGADLNTSSTKPVSWINGTDGNSGRADIRHSNEICKLVLNVSLQPKGR